MLEIILTDDRIPRSYPRYAIDSAEYPKLILKGGQIYMQQKARPDEGLSNIYKLVPPSQIFDFN